MTPPKITTTVLEAWKDQATAERLKWADATVADMTPQRRRDYEAGLRQGWTMAVQIIRLHGGIA